MSAVKGRGKVQLTGTLGDVMKESASAALSYARTRVKQLGLDPDFYRNRDIHIHMPAGATPKDGPSAGIAIATSVISALTGVPVRGDVAMTGEITLRGRVLPIGGLKEKLLAALRGGITTVLIPSENEKDLAEIPQALKDGFTTGSGLGLGLSGARRLSDEFEIESEPGKGTRVAIVRWKAY